MKYPSYICNDPRLGRKAMGIFCILSGYWVIQLNG